MKINLILVFKISVLFLISCKNKSVLRDEVYTDIEESFENYNLDSMNYAYSDEFALSDFNEPPAVIDRNPVKHASREIKNELIHTKLEVSVDWNKSQLNGKATLTLKPKCYTQSILELDAKGMDIKTVSMNNLPCAFYYEDSLKLIIDLDRTYKSSEEYVVHIEYVSKPENRETSGSSAITSDKGLYFINPLGEDENKMPQIWTQGETESSSVWFPTIDAPNIKTTQEIFITVNEKYKTLSNGKLVSSKTDENGNRTDYWKQDKPHAPYLFMIAVGEFDIVEDEYKRADGSKIDVDYYVEPKYKKDAQDIFGETPEMIEFFSKLLGVEYEWDKYSQIVVREYVSGAMENTGAVVFGDYVYKNKRELLDGNDQSTIAHELFHHWFGDLVTCESWSNLPMNESFANYSQYLWDEYKYGRDEADYNADIEAQGYFNSSAFGGYHDLIWYDYNDKEDMFDAHSYNKGGRILHMLRSHLGDEVFFSGLNKYLNDNKYKAAEYNHLRLALEEVSGKDLNWFFDQWFLGKGHPVLFIDYTINEKEKTVVVQVQQVQNHDFPIFKIPLKVGVWDGKGYHTENIFVDDMIQEFIIGYSGNLKNILFDNDQMILGRVAEKKPSKFYLYQLKSKNTPLKARTNALNRLKGSKYWEEALFYALNDEHWSIRKKAITSISELHQSSNLNEVEKVEELFSSMCESEKKPKVLSELINVSSGFNFINVTKLEKIATERNSYSVQNSALKTLLKLDKEKFNVVLDSLFERNEENEKLLICDVLSQSGDDSYYSILKSMALENGNSTFEFRAFVSYMIYVTQAKENGDHYDWLVDLINLYEKRAEQNSGVFKMYSWRIKMYLKEFINGILVEINQNIADVETSNRKELVEQKEKIENLLQSLN